MPSKITIVLSLMLHAAGVLMFVGLPSASPPESDEVIMLASQILPTDDSEKKQEEKPSDDPERQEIQEAPPAEEAPPVEYAGAPKIHGEPDEPAEPEQPQEQVPELPAAAQKPPAKKAPDTPQPAPVASESELAAAANRLRENGVKVPGLDLPGVGLQTLKSIAAAGQGMFIARCDDTDYSIAGALMKPKGLIPITGKQGDWLSDRSALVSDSNTGAVRERLMWDYGYSRDKAFSSAIRLSFGNRLDRLILLRQKQSARSLNLELSAVVRTAGRFVWNGGRVVDFQVVSITLRDGRILKPGAASTSTLVLEPSIAEKGSQQ